MKKYGFYLNTDSNCCVPGNSEIASGKGHSYGQPFWYIVNLIRFFQSWIKFLLLLCHLKWQNLTVIASMSKAMRLSWVLSTVSFEAGFCSADLVSEARFYASNEKLVTQELCPSSLDLSMFVLQIVRRLESSDLGMASVCILFCADYNYCIIIISSYLKYLVRLLKF